MLQEFKIADVCAELRKNSIAKAEARASASIGEEELADTCNGIMRHMMSEANAGKSSATYQIADKSLRALALAAVKTWDGCKVSLSKDSLVISW